MVTDHWIFRSSVFYLLTSYNMINQHIQWQSKLFGRLEKKFSSIYIYEMKEAADL